ncbi:MAG: hypothetical protein ACJAV1_001151 [Paraglaciecola sp.]|jgi:hypothetical protein
MRQRWSMGDHHLIHSALLSLDFSDQKMADDFQAQSANVVKQRILPLIDKIFDRVSQDDQVISIETLTLDLGDIDANDYLSTLEDKLQEVLSEQLRSLLSVNEYDVKGSGYTSRADDRSQGPSIEVLTNNDSQWQQLAYYLLHGVMPWNFTPPNQLQKQQAHTKSPTIKWLDNNVETHLSATLDLIRQSKVNGHDHRILSRLINQLSSFCLNKLINQMDGDAKLLTFELLVAINKYPHSDAAIARFIKQGWQQRIAQSFFQHQPNILQADWPLLISTYSDILVQALRYYGQQSQLSALLTSQYSTSMLADIVKLLEPQEHLFIHQLLNRPELFTRGLGQLNPLASLHQDKSLSPIPQHISSQTPAQIKNSHHHLWQYTLDYLLVERGSHFNRKSYLASLITKMANHHNVAPAQMFDQLILSLALLPGHSALKSAMQHMLYELGESLTTSLQGPVSAAIAINTQAERIATQHRAAESINANQRSTVTHRHFTEKNNNDDSLSLTLSQAIIEGRGDLLESQWASIVRHQAPLLSQLLHYHGQQSSIRQSLAQGFSERMLHDIVLVLAPTSQEFIKQVLTHRSQLFVLKVEDLRNSALATNNQLWEFTLGYLLVERGSAFNKKAYLLSVTQQMAARHNLHHEQLLHQLTLTLQQFNGSGLFKKQLQNLLAELTQQARDKNITNTNVNVINDTIGVIGETINTALLPAKLFNALLAVETLSQNQWLNKIHQAIKQGDEKGLNIFWSILLSLDPVWFKSLIEFHGRSSPEVRHNLSQGLTEQGIYQLIGLLAPSAQGFIQTALKSTLWHKILTTKVVVTKSVILAKTTQVKAAINIDHKAIKQSFSEFTLTYLLVERGSEFNNNSYLTSLLRQLSAHYNLNYQHVIDTLLQVLTLRTSTDNQQIVSLLQHIGQQEKYPISQTKPAAGDNQAINHQLNHVDSHVDSHEVNHQQKHVDSHVESDVDKHMACYQHFLLLSAYLTSSSPLSSTDIISLSQTLHLQGINKSTSSATYFSQCLHMLLQHQPLLLHRLLTSSQTRDNYWLVAVSVLNTVQINQLLRAFLSLSQVKTKDNHSGSLYNMGAMQSPFLQTIEQLAKRLSGKQQQHYFYAAIFKALAADQVIDLEQIMSTITHAVDKQQADLLIKLTQRDEAKIQLETDVALGDPNAREIMQRLLATKKWSQVQIKQLHRVIEHLFLSDEQGLTQLIKPAMKSQNFNNKLIKHLAERLLIKLLLLLKAKEYLALHPYAQLLTNLSYHHPQYRRHQQGTRLTVEHRQWQYIFHYLMVEGRAFSVKTFVSGFIAYLSDGGNALNPQFTVNASVKSSAKQQEFQHYLLNQLRGASLASQQTLKDTVMQVINAQEAIKPANAAINTPVTTTQGQAITPQLAAQLVPERPAEQRAKTPQKPATPLLWKIADDNAIKEQITVHNAGLVLAAPYIPRLFNMLGLVEQGTFTEQEHVYRAVHLLQYLNNGSSETDEYHLALNKVLCGITVSQPIPYTITITEHEKNTVEGLLSAIIQHWTSLGKTSIAGLQQTFLQREGYLMHQEESWKLQVPSTTFDILIDQIPWTYSLIKYPWMQQPLHVNWR